jgi:hypothetical protein
MAIHDYTEGHNYWGHASTPIGDRRADGTRRYCLFGRRIATGDIVLLSSSSKHEDGTSGVLQYRVVGDVHTPMDPGDQHFVNLLFMEQETNDAGGRHPETKAAS